jgi:hypothetical protein
MSLLVHFLDFNATENRIALKNISGLPLLWSNRYCGAVGAACNFFAQEVAGGLAT